MQLYGWYNDQTLFSTQWKQVSCPPFDPQIKVEEKLSGIWSVCSVPLPLPLSQQNRSCQLLITYQRKWSFKNGHHSMPHVVPFRSQSRYPRAPREPGSTLFQPQLHPPIGRYTSSYIRKPVDDIFLDNRALTELKLSDKIKHRPWSLAKRGTTTFLRVFLWWKLFVCMCLEAER
jgi:hypothetical protein